MKTPSVLGILFLSSALCASEIPAPAFPDARIELPPLSLGDAAKARLARPLGERPVVAAQQGFAVGPARKTVSRMPVLRPKETDAAIAITPRDNGVHYQLRVKQPDVEPAK